MREIPNKQYFYSLSKKLLLGNRLQQWTFKEFEDLFLNNPSQLPYIVGIRHVRQSFTNKGTSGLYQRGQAYEYGKKISNQNDLLYDEGAVHGNLTLQGEIQATERGLYLRYSFLQCHQRTLWHIDQNGLEGLEKHQIPHNIRNWYWGGSHGFQFVQHAWGLKASSILQEYMDDPSWQKLNEILACQLGEENSWGDPVLNFSHPTVEFASFNKPIGVLGWNSVFWEVRNIY